MTHKPKMKQTRAGKLQKLQFACPSKKELWIIELIEHESFEDCAECRVKKNISIKIWQKAQISIEYFKNETLK